MNQRQRRVRRLVAVAARIPVKKVVDDTIVSEEQAIAIYNQIAGPWGVFLKNGKWRMGTPTTYAGIMGQIEVAAAEVLARY